MANDNWGKGDEVIKQDEPGWFQPGSKTEALARGFSQGATFGFGDELQSYLRAIGDDSNGSKSYLERAKQLRDEERLANQQSAAKNPGSYLAGSIAAAIPQGMNIASVAKGAAPIAGSQALGSASRGVGTGGLYGVMQGAGNAETIADIPKEAAIQGTIGAATGALTGGTVGKGMTVTPEALKLAEQKLLSAVGRGTRPLEKTAAEYIDAAKEAGKNNLVSQLVTSGSGAGAGLYSASKQDWTADPYSAAGAVAKDAALGALGGYAVTRGVAGGMAAKDALKQGVKELPPYLQAANTLNAHTMGKSNVAASSFTALREMLKSVPEDEKRKKAMALQSTPEGRAFGNDDSPIHNEDWGSQDELIK